MAVSFLRTNVLPLREKLNTFREMQKRKVYRRISCREAILPGATIGVLGSGQLGRMFAISARRMGYRVHTYSPDRDSPTGQIADVEFDAPYEDLDRVREFASGGRS